MTRLATTPFAILIAAFVSVSGLRAEHSDPVAVLASADPDYAKQKFSGSGAKPKPESYLFAKGRFFGGELRDSSLEDARFSFITDTLAPALAKQEYFPAREAKNADLLIVVHWGTTDVDEQGQWLEKKALSDAITNNAAANGSTKGSNGNMKATATENAQLDASLLDAAQGSVSHSMAGNEQLLGFSQAVQKEDDRSAAVASGITQEDYDLQDDLLEERYFVILMAYDFAAVRTHQKPRLLWSIHFNMRSPGHSFTSALPAMSKVAANYFGHNVDGLVLNAAKVPIGKVEIGEPKTVEDGKPTK
jgi:hypothetical protein